MSWDIFHFADDGTYWSGTADGINYTTNLPNFAVQFNGAGQYATINNFSGLQFPTSFSIDFWTEGLDTLSGYPSSIFLENGYGYDTGWAFDAFDGSNTINFALYESSSNMVPSSGPVSVESGWHHIVVSRSGSTISMTIDGTTQANTLTYSGTISNSVDPVYIGGYQAAGSFSSITIDHLKIISSSTTLGDWEFNEGRGSSAGNSSGVAPAAVLFGSPAWVPGE